MVGLAAKQAKLMVECAVPGQRVTGSAGSTDQWLRIGPKQYIPAAHDSSGGAADEPDGTGKHPDNQDAQQVSAQRCTTP